MQEFYLSVQSGNNRLLCLAPLTDRIIEDSGQSIPDVSGYFLYEKTVDDGPAEVEIIARILSPDAAHRVAMLLKMT